MKHIKLFESYFPDYEKQPGSEFKSDDISKSGDTVLCWNLEDGWTVALANEEEAVLLLDSLKDMYTVGLEFTRNSNIAFVVTGYPKDMDIKFLDSIAGQKIKNDINYLISPEMSEPIEQDTEYATSCIFSLKRGMTIMYRWNGGSVETMPIKEYISLYGKSDEDYI